MLLILLGYFLLPSPAEGAYKAFTCSPGPLAATCDAGKVILIRQVRRGSYFGAFNGSHCKYHVGDSFEPDDGDSKEVWKDCNLQSTCSVPFIQSGNYYLEMDYECMYKSNIDMLDICNNGSGTRLVANHGYIHSPCYPNLSTWTDSTHVYCQCSGTFQHPVRFEDLTISVFHAFQETEKLEIRWHVITNPPEIFRNTSPSFKKEQRVTGSFYLKFYSSYQGSDWDRGFWVEFTANSPLEFKCSNNVLTLPTCQAPIPPSTTPTTTATTSTTTTTTTTTHTTTITAPVSTTSSPRGGLPGVKTRIPGTSTTSISSTTNVTSKAVDVSQSQLSQRDATGIAVGIAVPLILISVVTAVLIVLWRRGTIAHLCKYHSGENTNDVPQTNTKEATPVYENVGTEYENVFRSNFVNPAFVDDEDSKFPQISDIGDSSYVNVPDKAANPTNSHDQMMPTYVNIETTRGNQGARDLGTNTHRQEAPAPPNKNYSPYAEIGDTGTIMPGVGAEVVRGEGTESPYAKLEPVERSEYLDLRHLGFAHQSQSK